MKRTTLLCSLIVAMFLTVSVAVAAPVRTSSESPRQKTVIVATGRNYPDALSGGFLSYAYDAPILLTEQTAMPAVIVGEVQEINPSRALIIGSESVVAPGVESQLRNLGVTDVVRLAGADRFATSAQVASQAVIGLEEARLARLAEIRTLVAEGLETLTGRVRGLELRADSQDRRLASVEASLSAEDDFWPKDIAITIKSSGLNRTVNEPPRIYAGRWYFDHPFDPEGSPLISAEVRRGDTLVKTCILYSLVVRDDVLPDSIVVFHIGGKDYTGLWGTGEPPQEGAAVVAEYWFELYGQKIHETRTVVPAGWRYQR